MLQRNSRNSLHTFWQNPLITTQRRIRHLKSLAGRNLTFAKNLHDSKLFFALHLTEKSQPFYVSEKVPCSLNPTWRSFNEDEFLLDVTEMGFKSFVARIYQTQDDNSVLCLNWTVHFAALHCFGKVLEQDGVQLPPNSVVFGVHDAFFIAPPEERELTEPVLTLDVPEDVHVKKSYTVQSLARMQTILRVIKQTQCSADQARTNIIIKWQDTQGLEEKRNEKEKLALKVALLRQEKNLYMERVQRIKNKVEALRKENQDKEDCFRLERADLDERREELADKKQSYYSIREELLKIGAQLVMRRKHLVAELAMVYPIRLGSNGVHTIAGVELRHSEELQLQNEISTEVALGYACHLVTMISQFLDIPLRYPVIHRGSKSVIFDYIVENVPDKEREFPLFVKGKERFQCDYGVFLLNKNVAQLRFYCGMSTNDLRQTLGNLRALLHMKLGVRLDEQRAAGSAAGAAVPSTSGSRQRKETISTDGSASTRGPPGETSSERNYRRRLEEWPPHGVEGSREALDIGSIKIS